MGRIRMKTHDDQETNVGRPADRETSSSRSQPRAGVWKRRFLLLAMGSLVGFVTAEVALRLIAPQRLSSLLAWAETPGFEDLIVADEEIGWRMAPGYRGNFFKNTRVEINSLGLRDREYGEKVNGEIRVLSLGDSFAFGHGVEHNESYAKQLEARLQSMAGDTRVQVISGGVDGYNTYQAVMEFERLAPILVPDFVISSFVASNDVAENAVFERRLATGLLSPVGVFGHYSHVVRLGLKASFGPRVFAANRSWRNIDGTVELYRDYEQQLAESGIPYLFLMIPARHQVDPSVHKGSAILNFLGCDTYLMRHSRSLKEHFETDNVAHLDLMPVLVDQSQPTYFEDDSHTNAFGHARIAEAIAERIAPTILELRDSALAETRLVP